MGNPRFFDDPGTPDSGVGPLGWLDAGAIEFQETTPRFRLILQPPIAVRGRPLQVTAVDGSPASRIALFVSTVSTGVTHIPGLNVVVNLEMPVLIGPADARTDAQGRYQWTATIPKGAFELELLLQAVQHGATSRVSWTPVVIR